jgi:hypothetical protein
MGGHVTTKLVSVFRSATWPNVTEPRRIRVIAIVRRMSSMSPRK